MNNSDIIAVVFIIIAFMTCLFTSQCNKLGKKVIKLFSMVWNCFFQTKIDTYRKLHDQIDKEETQQLLSITDTNYKLIHILSTEWEPNNADSTNILCQSVLLRPCTPIFSWRLILKCVFLLEVNRKHHSAWKLVHAMCERMIVCNNNTQDSKLNRVIRLLSTDIVSFVNVLLPSGVLPYEINEKITIPPNISRSDWNRMKNRILESVLYSFKKQFQAMRKTTEPHSLDWDILEYVVQILLKLHHDPTNGLIQFPLKLQLLLYSYSDHRFDFRSFQMDQIHSFVKNQFPPILLQDEPKPGINLSGFMIEWKLNGNI